MKAGDRVWYWARRFGGAPHKKYGVITGVSESGVFARVRIEMPKIAVNVQSVAVSRLR